MTLLEGLDGDLPVARRHGAAHVAEAVARDIPDGPTPLADLAAYLRDIVFDLSMYPGHPGFLAYISGAGTVPGAAADLIAAALNQNTGGWRLAPAAVEIERHLVNWFAGRLGLPESTGGFVTSGGAMANMIGLTVARSLKAGWDVRARGLREGPQLTVYRSAEVHDTVDRAAQMLGLGDPGIREVPTNSELRMDTMALRARLQADIDAGMRPIAVVGSAGTVGTGAIDPLDEIADICDEFGLWLHVDGAYGGAAALVSSQAPKFAGIERADSVGFDAHKWLYTPIPSACILVRDADHLTQTFSVDPAYTYTDQEYTDWGIDVYQLSPHFTRPFSALKIWVSLLAHGWDAYERRIAHDIALAEYLHALAADHPELEPIGTPGLSIACYRYVPLDLPADDSGDEYLNKLNERILLDLQLGGRVFPSNALIHGRFALRACVVNFRTEADTIDQLVEATVRLGREADAAMRPGQLR